MNELIEQLHRIIARRRPDYYAQLQPGVGKQALDDFQHQLGAELPPVFRLLYSWRNGQNPDFSDALVDNWMFSPLEDVISSKELLDGMIGYDFEEPSWWGRGWVPFLSNGGGDHLCLDLTAEFGGQPGQVLIFWHDGDERPLEFPNMEAWLQAVVKTLAEEP